MAFSGIHFHDFKLNFKFESEGVVHVRKGFLDLWSQMGQNSYFEGSLWVDAYSTYAVFTDLIQVPKIFTQKNVWLSSFSLLSYLTLACDSCIWLSCDSSLVCLEQILKTMSNWHFLKLYAAFQKNSSDDPGCGSMKQMRFLVETLKNYACLTHMIYFKLKSLWLVDYTMQRSMIIFRSSVI